MDKSKNIVIAGAGLVGSVLAIILKQQGYKVLLFEKRPDLRKANISAGKSINLIITAKGIKTLKTAGVFSDVEKIISPVLGRMMHALSGELTFQPYGRDESEFNLSVSRGELNILLLNKAQEAGVEILFEEELLAIDFKNKTSSFSKSKNIQYDLFFGADGAGSATRAELQKVLKDKMSNTMISLGVKYKELFMPSGHDESYPIDSKSLHIWPRGEHMLMALPNQGGSFTMTVYVTDEMTEAIETRSEIENYFSQNYPDALEFMPNYIEQMTKNPWGFLGTVRCSPWVYEDSVCLVGDAAHAIVPFLGQGMNTGFSDIQYLVDSDLSFSRYSDFQKLNGDAIANMSIENYQVMSNKVSDRSFLLRKKIENTLETTYPDKFRSRYGLVTYTLIPYHIATEIGVLQSSILDELASGITNIGQLDLNYALVLINKKLTPFMEANNICIDRYY